MFIKSCDSFKTVIPSRAYGRCGTPRMQLQATCISLLAPCTAGGCHGATQPISHTSFTGCPSSTAVLAPALGQLPWHSPCALVHMLHTRAHIIPRAGKHSWPCSMMKSLTAKNHLTPLEMGREMFHTDPGFVWGRQSRWKRCSGTHKWFFCLFAAIWFW